MHYIHFNTCTIYTIYVKQFKVIKKLTHPNPDGFNPFAKGNICSSVDFNITVYILLMICFYKISLKFDFKILNTSGRNIY